MNDREGGDTGLKSRLSQMVGSLANYSERFGLNPMDDGKPRAEFLVGNDTIRFTFGKQRFELGGMPGEGGGRVEGPAQGLQRQDGFASALSPRWATWEDPSGDSGLGIERREGSEQDRFYLCLLSVTLHCGCHKEGLLVAICH